MTVDEEEQIVLGIAIPAGLVILGTSVFSSSGAYFAAVVVGGVGGVVLVAVNLAICWARKRLRKQ